MPAVVAASQPVGGSCIPARAQGQAWTGSSTHCLGRARSLEQEDRGYKNLLTYVFCLLSYQVTDLQIFKHCALKAGHPPVPTKQKFHALCKGGGFITVLKPSQGQIEASMFY